MSGPAIQASITPEELMRSRVARGVVPDLQGRKAIASYLGIHPNTVDRYKVPSFRWGRLVAAYSDIAGAWYAAHSARVVDGSALRHG